MKERPVLFSGPMVRALLNGTKTQTRRLPRKGEVKVRVPNPVTCWGPMHGNYTVRAGIYPSQVVSENSVMVRFLAAQSAVLALGDDFEWAAPAAVGDVLWVREHWRANQRVDDLPPRDIQTLRDVWYEADNSSVRDLGARPGRFRHGMFMPRWACRLRLEVTEVRLERLQDISEADAWAEGVTEEEVRAACGEAVGAYSVLWEQINGKGSWDENPWIWAYSFKGVPA